MKIAMPSYQVRAGCDICVGVEPPFLKSWIRHWATNLICDRTQTHDHIFANYNTDMQSHCLILHFLKSL